MFLMFSAMPLIHVYTYRKVCNNRDVCVALKTSGVDNNVLKVTVNRLVYAHTRNLSAIQNVCPYLTILA